MKEPLYLTTDGILKHPNFCGARDIYIDAVLDLYENNLSSMELMLDGGRIMVYGIIMALWGGFREHDVSSYPTIGRLKQAVGWFGVASPRQIDLVVARFAQVGHLQISPASHDLRMRLVQPRSALIEHDRCFIRVHYSALGELFGRDTYALPLAGDLAFLKAMRGAWIATLESMAKQIFIANRPILRFYAASAGMLMLMKLVRLQGRSPGRWLAVDYTAFGRPFGVSRTHVRTLLKAAAADGDIEIDSNGCLRLSSDLIAALDRNIAGRLSLLDRAHSAAMASL
ncbi:hypothetical protein [Rhodopseudomonas sp. B29]|uniref:hypothetical protein n=1 Tax=Rhodopseudomonas sp. B29 TaxID=95607 RepID=UPI0011D2662E|nr:hypothetical protein [Rhodopseudomonas sp. B29]